MSFAVSAPVTSARPAFLGGASALRASSKSAARTPAGRTSTTTMAFFGMGAAKQPPGVAMVCSDCGYVYRGTDFNDLPKDYKCPPCGSGKNAFRPEKKMDYKKDGFNAPGIRAAKRENKKAFEAKRAAARKAAEGGGKKKGLFGR